VPVVPLNQATRSPTLIIHAKDDTEIPSHHSSTLFSGLVSNRKVVGLEGSVESVDRPGWGVVTRFVPAPSGQGTPGQVMYFEGVAGGHNGVGGGEGVVELMREVAQL
jgi:abhydrolase domain-containing protein 12